jgi:hypothetical protein
MSDKTSLGASLRPAGSLLDRADSSPTPLSENQTLVDQIVSSSVSEAAKGSTLLAMFGAGAVSRLTRAGVMSLALGEGSPILPILTRGSSYAIALANESVTFAGIERGFHPSQTSFEKDWARAFINLGSLKLLGGAAEGQNLLLQHLVTDLGMVGGQQVGAQFGIVERPQGNFARQMVQAEVLNWSQKGGMALIHGLSPDLLPMEKSMDLYLRSREADLFPQEKSSPFFPQLAMATVGGPEGLLSESKKSEDRKGPSMVFSEGDPEGEGSISGGSLDPSRNKLLSSSALEAVKTNPSDPHVISMVNYLIELSEIGDVERREEATAALQELARLGVKSLELADTLHKRAKQEVDQAEALNRWDPMKQEYYRRAMGAEWNAASAVPPRNEFRRGDLYQSAVWFALKAERPQDARQIIFEALRDDFGAVAEGKLRKSAKEHPFWNKDRKIISNALAEAKVYLRFFQTFIPALATAGAGDGLFSEKEPLFLPMIMMMSRESGKDGDSGE